MKKCAYCGCPNEDAAVGCCECGEQFETSSSPDPEPQALDPALSPAIVAQFSNLQQASLLAGRLEAAGIQAWIPEEYSEQIFSGVVGLERLTVRVSAKDYKAAMAVVAEGAEPTSTSVTPGSSGRQKDARPERRAAQKDAEETSNQEARKLCESCGAEIPETAHLCSKCGWTQPNRGAS
jgi:ribosomal protein L40E